MLVRRLGAPQRDRAEQLPSSRACSSIGETRGRSSPRPWSAASGATCVVLGVPRGGVARRRSRRPSARARRSTWSCRRRSAPPATRSSASERSRPVCASLDDELIARLRVPDRLRRGGIRAGRGRDRTAGRALPRGPAAGGAGRSDAPSSSTTASPRAEPRSPRSSGRGRRERRRSSSPRRSGPPAIVGRLGRDVRRRRPPAGAGSFAAVGQWYERFDQVTDEEVREALAMERMRGVELAVAVVLGGLAVRSAVHWGRRPFEGADVADHLLYALVHRVSRRAVAGARDVVRRARLRRRPATADYATERALRRDAADAPGLARCGVRRARRRAVRGGVVPRSPARRVGHRLADGLDDLLGQLRELLQVRDAVGLQPLDHAARTRRPRPCRS